MSNLQTIAFGAASDGSQGDTTRAAFTKDNANVAVLNAQATLTSFATTITNASALTAAAHLGKRVNVNLATPGTINLPTATSCGADGVILIRNLGTTLVTLAITTSSGDSVALTTVAAGEAALMDTDGVHAWNCGLRGRSNSANEVVQGNCAVLGNETVGGTLIVTGATTLTGGVAGATPFAVRPTFNSNTPWDSGNLTPGNYALTSALSGYMPMSGGSFSGAPTYSTLAIARAAYQNTASGKVLITGFHSGATFTGQSPTTWAAEVDQTSSWGSSNTFVPPVTGIYRIQANLLISSAPASGTQIQFGLALSSNNSVVANEVFICGGGSFFVVRFELVKQLTAATGYYLQINPTASVTTSTSTTSNRFSIEQIA